MYQPENELLKVKKINPKQHFTQPPARYNEASLVKALEELGIGRPSTYASIITTIQDRQYVEKKQKNLYPTELGKVVTKLLEQYFEQIVNLEFTADIESKLDIIAEGNNQWCEKCGSPMVIKHGRFGRFLACSNYPDCKNAKPILQKLGIKCPKCGEGDIIVRKSKKGKVFYGCSKYPDCDFVSWDKPTGNKCPDCGSPLVETDKKSRHKEKCSNKECKYKG